MKPPSVLILLPMAASAAATLFLTGCAVQQPMARQRTWTAAEETPVARGMLAAPAAKRPAAKAKTMAAAPEPAPEPAAEQAAEPAAAAEPAPEPQTQAAAEPTPKRRGPLTRSEEIEIDNQVMP